MGEPTPITEVLAAVQPPPKRGEAVQPCREVYVAKTDKSKMLPYWRAVSRGNSYGVNFLYTNPRPCLLVPSTRIRYVDSCEYSVAESKSGSNMVVSERCGSVRNVYVYPKKVWEEIMKLYVEPLVRGEQPYDTGVILTGPPGTGKSSLAYIAARYAGVNVTTIDTSILSPYIGESEANLRERLEWARGNQPSIVILDEAEWLLFSRSLAGGEKGSMETVRTNLQRILLVTMQEVHNMEERVLFIAATNYKTDLLDQAFMRYGRFGPPLFVPLPDYEAVEIVLSNMLKDPGKARELAKTVVNSGLSLADAIGLAKRLRYGLDAKPRTVSGRGYARVHVREVAGFGELEKRYRVPLHDMLRGKARLWVEGPEELATPIAVQLAYAAGRTAMRLTDPRYIDEAVYTASTLEAVMITPTLLDPGVQYYIADNLDSPIIFVGERPPAVLSFKLGSIRSIMRMLGPEPILRALLAYKDIELEDEEVKRIAGIMRESEKKAHAILTAVATTGVAKPDYIENLAAWI